MALRDWIDARWTWGGAVAGLAAAGGGAWFGHASFEHFMLCLALLFAAAIPMLIWGLALMVWVGGRRRRGLAARTGPVSVWLAALLALSGTLLSFVAGIPVEQWMQARAKSWAEAQVAAVERHQLEHGALPTALEEVADMGSAPWLVRQGDLHYSVSGGCFGFDLWTGFLSGYSWWSTERRWHWYD